MKTEKTSRNNKNRRKSAVHKKKHIENVSFSITQISNDRKLLETFDVKIECDGSTDDFINDDDYERNEGKETKKRHTKSQLTQ